MHMKKHTEITYRLFDKIFGGGRETVATYPQQAISKRLRQARSRRW